MTTTAGGLFLGQRDELVVAGDSAYPHLDPILLGALDAGLGARNEIPPDVPRPYRRAADHDHARLRLRTQRSGRALAQHGECAFAVDVGADRDAARNDIYGALVR